MLISIVLWQIVNYCFASIESTQKQTFCPCSFVMPNSVESSNLLSTRPARVGMVHYEAPHAFCVSNSLLAILASFNTSESLVLILCFSPPRSRLCVFGDMGTSFCRKIPHSKPKIHSKSKMHKVPRSTLPCPDATESKVYSSSPFTLRPRPEKHKPVANTRQHCKTW